MVEPAPAVLAVSCTWVVPCGMSTVNAPPGSIVTGAPSARRVSAPSTSPRTLLTNPGTDGATDAGTWTRGPAATAAVDVLDGSPVEASSRRAATTTAAAP